MKKFTFLAASLFLFAAVNAQEVKPVQPEVKLQQAEVKDISKLLVFKNDNYDFGKIAQNKPVEFELEIKNISSDSISIVDVSVGCGCTTPAYEKNVMYAPGQSFKVKLGFNGSGMGSVTKNATVRFSNGMQKVVLFKAEIFAAPDNSAPQNNGLGKIKPAN
ncbi:MAG: hypothetical protein K0Q66_1815 [Chitinophagaceae bacterium]|nr:hypothetical protein [Chitinophagaceae bacterium]